MARLQMRTEIDEPFRVDMICEAPAPDGGGEIWQQYVISQGPNTITGMRPGTRGEVASQVEEMVARLNLRRMGKNPK